LEKGTPTSILNISKYKKNKYEKMKDLKTILRYNRTFSD